MINPDSNNFEKATLDPSANMRDHFANERTFLVWIRTSIAMMGFGFVIVKYSINSAKIQTSVGGDLTKAADRDIGELRSTGMIKTIFGDLNSSLSNEDLNSINMLPDSTVRNLLLDSSIAHLNEAIRIYKTHSNAWLLLGNAMYKRNHKLNL